MLLRISTENSPQVETTKMPVPSIVKQMNNAEHLYNAVL